jgi:hypothetical protein
VKLKKGQKVWFLHSDPKEGQFIGEVTSALLPAGRKMKRLQINDGRYMHYLEPKQVFTQKSKAMEAFAKRMLSDLGRMTDEYERLVKERKEGCKKFSKRITAYFQEIEKQKNIEIANNTKGKK